MSASLFPLQELMLICKGCGGERLIPEDELAKITSVDEFEKFTKSRIAIYSCRCGAKTCDIRMLPNAAALAERAAAKVAEDAKGGSKS